MILLWDSYYGHHYFTNEGNDTQIGLINFPESQHMTALLWNNLDLRAFRCHSAPSDSLDLVKYRHSKTGTEAYGFSCLTSLFKLEGRIFFRMLLTESNEKGLPTPTPVTSKCEGNYYKWLVSALIYLRIIYWVLAQCHNIRQNLVHQLGLPHPPLSFSGSVLCSLFVTFLCPDYGEMWGLASGATAGEAKQTSPSGNL